AVGVFGPPRGGGVQVYVSRLEPDPVHGRQVADRIGALRVGDQLGGRGGSGGEVQQQRVVHTCRVRRLKLQTRVLGVGIAQPPLHVTDTNPCPVALQVGELRSEE